MRKTFSTIQKFRQGVELNFGLLTGAQIVNRRKWSRFTFTMLLILCNIYLSYPQSLLDKIIITQNKEIVYKNTPYESIISFANNKRNEVLNNFNLDYNKQDSLYLIEGYNPVTGNLYGMLWIKKKGYFYIIKVNSQGNIFVKTKIIRSYNNNEIFNHQILLDVENWNMDKNTISRVHDGLYIIAVKVNKEKNLDYVIKTKQFYEY